MINQPLCFVLMPFGKKADAAGAVIDFDAVYHEIIAPAVAGAGLEPIRADEEQTGGLIHKPMFERLVLCQYAVADLTAANANVFYELGVRHAARPWSTVCLFADGGRLPFDVAPLRALPYKLAADGTPANSAGDRAALAARLGAAKSAARDGAATDSPLFQLIKDYPNVDFDDAEIFREQVRCTAMLRDKLTQARTQDVGAVQTVESEIADFEAVEAGVVFDLMKSYRAVKGWRQMIELVAKVPRPLAETTLMQEHLAFALNRDGRGDEAEQVLLRLLERRGASSETLGLLGRVYKDRWEAALKRGETFAARGLLDKAIDAYRRGFEADWRDPYPGVNAATLMEIKDKPDPQRKRLIPVVTYAAEQRIAAGKPGYWDYATLLELAALGKEEELAAEALSRALAAGPERWEKESTARNLRLIREARARRQEAEAWLTELEVALAS